MRVSRAAQRRGQWGAGTSLQRAPPPHGPSAGHRAPTQLPQHCRARCPGALHLHPRSQTDASRSVVQTSHGPTLTTGRLLAGCNVNVPSRVSSGCSAGCTFGDLARMSREQPENLEKRDVLARIHNDQRSAARTSSDIDAPNQPDYRHTVQIRRIDNAHNRRIPP